MRTGGPGACGGEGEGCGIKADPRVDCGLDSTLLMNGAELQKSWLVPAEPFVSFDISNIFMESDC